MNDIIRPYKDSDREYGHAIEVSSDVLEYADSALIAPSPAPGVPLLVYEQLRHSHDSYVKAGTVPAGEPDYIVGPVREQWANVPCPDTGLDCFSKDGEWQRCPHMREDDEDYEWPHKELNGKMLHSFAWYKIVRS